MPCLAGTCDSAHTFVVKTRQANQWRHLLAIFALKEMLDSEGVGVVHFAETFPYKEKEAVQPFVQF